MLGKAVFRVLNAKLEDLIFLNKDKKDKKEKEKELETKMKTCGNLLTTDIQSNFLKKKTWVTNSLFNKGLKIIHNHT